MTTAGGTGAAASRSPSKGARATAAPGEMPRRDHHIEAPRDKRMDLMDRDVVFVGSQPRLVIAESK